MSRHNILAAIAANEARHAELVAMLGDPPASAPVAVATPAEPARVVEVCIAAPMRADFVAETEPSVEVAELATDPLALLYPHASAEELAEIHAYMAGTGLRAGWAAHTAAGLDGERKEGS